MVRLIRLIRLIPVFIIFGCMVGLTGCKNDDPIDVPVNEAVDLVRLAKMEDEIDDLIGETTCGDAKDCRSIAFGAKPCGGPWGYKIYSVSGLDTLQLADLVDGYNKFNAVLNERYGWDSDCMAVSPPKIDCVEGHCVAVE